jgi:Ca2+-transporting ATPase
LTFVSAVASGKEESVLTAVQLLWVNLIMDTFAALALGMLLPWRCLPHFISGCFEANHSLATDPPTRTILNRRPEPKSAPLITLTMWKMIIGQSIFQLTVTFVLNFAGAGILNYDPKNEHEMMQLKTLVFNTFVWMQIFNQYK